MNSPRYLALLLCVLVTSTVRGECLQCSIPGLKDLADAAEALDDEEKKKRLKNLSDVKAYVLKQQTEGLFDVFKHFAAARANFKRDYPNATDQEVLAALALSSKENVTREDQRKADYFKYIAPFASEESFQQLIQNQDLNDPKFLETILNQPSDEKTSKDTTNDNHPFHKVEGAPQKKAFLTIAGQRLVQEPDLEARALGAVEKLLAGRPEEEKKKIREYGLYLGTVETKTYALNGGETVSELVKRLQTEKNVLCFAKPGFELTELKKEEGKTWSEESSKEFHVSCPDLGQFFGENDAKLSVDGQKTLNDCLANVKPRCSKIRSISGTVSACASTKVPDGWKDKDGKASNYELTKARQKNLREGLLSSLKTLLHYEPVNPYQSIKNVRDPQENTFQQDGQVNETSTGTCGPFFPKFKDSGTPYTGSEEWHSKTEETKNFCSKKGSSKVTDDAYFTCLKETLPKDLWKCRPETDEQARRVAKRMHEEEHYRLTKEDEDIITEIFKKPDETRSLEDIKNEYKKRSAGIAKINKKATPTDDPYQMYRRANVNLTITCEKPRAPGTIAWRGSGFVQVGCRPVMAQAWGNSQGELSGERPKNERKGLDRKIIEYFHQISVKCPGVCTN